MQSPGARQRMHTVVLNSSQAPWISQFGEDKWLIEHLFYNRRNGEVPAC